MKPAAEHIRVRAYFLWVEEGRPQGRAINNWIEAEIIENYEAHKSGRMRLQFPHGNLSIPFRS